MKKWAVPYHYMGKQHTLEVYAEDGVEALARIRAAHTQKHDPEEIVFETSVPSWFRKLVP